MTGTILIFLEFGCYARDLNGKIEYVYEYQEAKVFLITGQFESTRLLLNRKSSA